MMMFPWGLTVRVCVPVMRFPCTSGDAICVLASKFSTLLAVTVSSFTIRIGLEDRLVGGMYTEGSPPVDDDVEAEGIGLGPGLALKIGEELASFCDCGVGEVGGVCTAVAVGPFVVGLFPGAAGLGGGVT
jgi:hypothetical protein